MADSPDVQPAVQAHPEEMKAAWEFSMGKVLTVHASARCTPAGVVAAGLAAAAILLAVGAVIRPRRS